MLKCLLVLLLGILSPLAVHAAQISLAWDDTANTVHTEYILQRRLNVATGTYAEVARPAKALRAYVDTTVTDSVGYCYVIQASRTSPVAVSPVSNEACGVAGTLLMAPVLRLVP